MTFTLIPIFVKSSSRLGKIEMTPMLPVMVEGWAMMKSQAEAM